MLQNSITNIDLNPSLIHFYMHHLRLLLKHLSPTYFTNYTQKTDTKKLLMGFIWICNRDIRGLTGHFFYIIGNSIHYYNKLRYCVLLVSLVIICQQPSHIKIKQNFFLYSPVTVIQSSSLYHPFSITIIIILI